MGDEPELTAEIAAKLFGPKDLSQPEPEPEVEDLPPADKPVSEWTEAEVAASHQSFDRAMREKAKAEQHQQEALREQAMRTPEQRHNDTLAELVSHDRKRQADAALIRSIHPPGDKTA